MPSPPPPWPSTAAGGAGWPTRSRPRWRRAACRERPRPPRRIPARPRCRAASAAPGSAVSTCEESVSRQLSVVSSQLSVSRFYANVAGAAETGPLSLCAFGSKELFHGLYVGRSAVLRQAVEEHAPVLLSQDAIVEQAKQAAVVQRTD